MNRRDFIKMTSGAGIFSLLPSQALALFHKVGMSCPELSNRKIVIIQLFGANDGINTLVPIDQYATYANLRPDIKLELTGANAVINLDAGLPIQDQIGLHPILTGFKDLYDNGAMRIIQGVGYPAANKSHFKSTDIWFSGGDGTNGNSSIASGSIGRLFETYYANYLNTNYPLGIQVGSSDNSLLFFGNNSRSLSLNLTGQDPQGFYSIVNSLSGQAPSQIPNSEYGDLIQYILNSDNSTQIYAQAISTAFNAGANSVTYPNTNLSNQLKTVARLISGGLESKVYLVKLGSFDTHDLQVLNNGDTHLGRHASLLQELSEAVHTFIADLNAQSLGQDVLTMTTSEFGRKAGQNANFGTDHGEIAPLFLFGSNITPGVQGTNVNLAEAIPANNYQIQTVQYDFRRVFATIFQDWLGTSNQTLDQTLFDSTQNLGFASAKIPSTISTSSTVDPTCYQDVLSNAVFPVRILGFYGRNTQEEKHDLFWEVLGEVNVSHYEVEKEIEGIFESIASVVATGIPQQQRYQYTNEKPSLGKNIYRLKAIDLDGTHTYSAQIQLLHLEDDLTSHLIVFPNPCVGELYIEVNESENIQALSLFDVNGKTCFEQSYFDGIAHTQKINLSQQAEGFYFLSVKTSQNHYQQQILIKR